MLGGLAAVEVLLPVRVAGADPARARGAPGHPALLRDGAALLRAVFKLRRAIVCRKKGEATVGAAGGGLYSSSSVDR